jgi:apolipoprotein N-acyltransferase
MLAPLFGILVLTCFVAGVVFGIQALVLRKYRGLLLAGLFIVLGLAGVVLAIYGLSRALELAEKSAQDAKTRAETQAATSQNMQSEKP